MAADPRITKARRVLAEGVKKAAEIASGGGQRSTVTRNVYKAKAEAADKALEILSARPKRS